MVLHDGAAFDVLKWDIGASQPDPTGWVVPAVCFPDESKVPLAAEVVGWEQVFEFEGQRERKCRCLFRSSGFLSPKESPPKRQHCLNVCFRLHAISYKFFCQICTFVCVCFFFVHFVY